jgi:Calx-beta domain
MKKSVNSNNRKFGLTRLIGLAAIVLIAVVFISALPNVRAQASDNGSFFGLPDLFNWQTDSVSTPTSFDVNQLTSESKALTDDSFAPNAAVTTNGGSGLAGTYPDLASAITALNAATITSPVVINATGTETAPVGGFTITATGTAANTITIDGGGTTTITAFTPQTSSILHDAIFEIVGGDFITISGFTMLENAANTTTTAGSNNMTEFGVALFYATTTNGAQNNTIQNNTITLNRTYQNTFGIYSNSTHTATTVTTSASATTTAGGNSGLKIYGNTISNINQGIIIVGPTAAADANTGIDIGGAGGAQANSITNFGTTGTFSGYANVSGTVNGILVRNSNGSNISFNTVTSSVGGTTVGTLNGIQIPAASAVPTATFTNTINNNTISLQSGLTAGAMNGITYPSGSASATSTLNINNNNFNTFGHTVAGASGTITFINDTATNQFTTINGNTFTNMSVNTTGSVTFISQSFTAPATGTKAVNNNSIVTGFAKTGAGGTVTFVVDNGSTVSGAVSNCQNNNFSNVTLTGATAITGISYTDGGTAPTRTVTGNALNNWTTGAAIINAMNFTYWNGVSSLSSNTITNITGQGAITGVTIGSTVSTATSVTIASNTINNLSSTGTGGAVIGITDSNTSTLININSNTINTLSSSGASLVNGITVSAATTTNVLKNKIYDLSGSNASSTASGILISGGTTVSASNNLIGDLRTPAANAANPLIGLNITGGTTVNAYFNTVYLNGASSGALFGSSAISASTTPALTLRNNIFSNTSTVTGAGLAVAYRRSTTTLTSYQSASNNNDFNASTIYNDGTTSQTTIAAYKALVSPRDSASFNEAPTFVSTTGSNANFLHISTASPTQLESGGAAISGITDDFDGDTRNVSTPDIGADEFAGTGLDLSAPNITYTNLANTASTTDRTLTVTITDASGVAGGTLAPRIYYRKNAGGYFSSQCTGSSPTYTCTIFVSNLGGVVATDVIGYFVVAQDVNGNLGSNPGGAMGTDVNNITTPPTPNTYSIIPTIGGNKTVGSAVGSDYPTLTAAVAALNAAEISGAVTLTLTDASYSAGETFPLTINANNGSSAANTVTIKPAVGVTTAISGSSAACVIGFNGADYMTIDGSNAVGGTTRDLTITNTSTGITSAVVCLQNTAALDGATNNVVKNTNIVGNTNLTTLFGVFSGGTAISATSVGTGNNTNTIQNNNLSKTQFGIYSQGASAANKNSGNIITQNLMNAVSPNNIGKGGIQVGFENSVTISENNISGINTTADDWGITLGLTSWTATTFTGNEVTNATVIRNNIGVVVNTGTNSAAGIAVASAASGTNLIANNFISGVTANSTPGDIAAGIFLGGGTGSTTNVYFNSVSMTGDRGTGTTASSLALAIGGTNPIVNARNNILYNTQTTVSTGRSYAIGTAYGPTGAANFSNLTSDNNDLFTSGANAGFSVITTLNSGTELTSLAAWQTATGKDAASVSGDPKFMSATELHIDTSMTTVVSNAGTPISGITIDIDGDTRTATPDIGADEFTPPAGAGTLQFSAVAYTDTEGNNATITVSRVGGTTGAISVMYATGDGTAISGICGSGGDYVTSAGTLNFADTVTSQTFNVQLCNDASAESSETVTLTLSNPLGTTITGTNPATLNITDNPPGTVQFSATTYSGNEGMTATITATRTGGGSGVVTVNYAAADGTATGGSCPGSDYASTSGTLTWINNDTANKTFTVQLCSDTAAEATETVNLTLSNVTGGAGLGTAAATLSIFDVASQFCNADGTISIPTVGTSTPYPSVINVSGLSGNTNTVRVTLNNAQHTDMTDLDILLVSPTGQKFILLSDASSPAGLDLPATLTFSDAGALLPTTGQVPSGTYQPRDVGSGDTFAAPAPAGPYVSPASVGTGTLNGTFGGANPNGAWNLYVVDDASGDVGTIGGWCLEITTAAVVVPTVDLSVDTNSASETGPTSVTVMATASSAVVGNQTVDLTVTGTGITAGDYTLSPTTITILNGATTGTATFTVVDDLLVEGTETATITEGNPSAGITLGATTFQNVVITDNDVAAQPGTFQFNPATYSIGEGGGNASLTVTRTGGSDGAVAVTYSLSSGTATGGSTCTGTTDFNNTGGTISFAAAQTSQTISVPICDDSIFESNENFTVTINSADNGGTIGTPATATVTITENDTAPSLQFNSATYSNADDFASNRVKSDELAPSVATITVTRTGASGDAVSVNYATGSGSATGGAACAAGSGVDYVSTNGTLNFAAGVMMQTFSITVCTDNLFEGSETVNLALTSPTAPAVLGTPNTATLTLTDNETIPTLQFSSATYTNSDDIAALGITNEEFAPSVATITVTRTGATDNAVSVNYATMGGTATGGAACTTGVDYILASGTLNFALGDVSKTFSVTVCTDALFEGDETVGLVLTTPVGGALGTPNSATLTITDNEVQPALQFNSATYTVGEGGGSATITVTRTGATDNAVSVNYATSNGTATGGAACAAGTDYDSTSGTLNFAAGDISKTFTVAICEDALAEGDETVNLALTLPTGGVLGTPATAILTITDNEGQPSLQFSAATASVGEGGSTVTLTVTRSGASGNAVSVDYATAGGTATSGATCAAGVDFIAANGTLNFGSGVTSLPLNVTICDDSVYENSESFTATLSNAGGGAIIGSPSVNTVTINDNDFQPSYSIDAVTQNEGSSGTSNFVFTVTKIGASAVNTSVNYQTADGSATVADNDYAATSGTLTFLPADTTKTITVVVNGDTVVEPNETFVVNLSGIFTRGTPGGVGTIVNDDVAAAPTVSLSVTANSGTEAGTTAITVSAVLTGGTVGTAQTVTLGTSGTATLASDYTLSGGNLSGTTLTIPANSTSGSTTFTVINDAVAESTETATLTISNPSAGIVLGSPTMQSISIIDNDTAGVTVTPTTVNVTEGGATAGYTVVLTSQPTANVTVTITPDAQVSVNSTTLTFTPANYNTPQTVTVTAVNDTTVEGNHTGTITQSAASSDANYNGIAVASVTANITDNDFIPTVSLSVNPSTGTEAGQTVVTVTATATSAVQGNQTVSLAVSGTNITAGDYTLSGTTITILSGQTTGSVTFTIVDDAAVEGPETATLTISNPSAGITLGSPTMQNVTITDNDSETTPPVITYTAFGNTGSTANPTLAVTITDNVAVPTSGMLVPRIYYRKNTGSYFSTACVLASGTGQNGSWNCTVDYALVGGAASGDSITYFVIAQDTSGNLASNPAGATGSDVNNLTAAPPAPNLYDIGTNSTVPAGTYTFLNTGSATLGGNVTIVTNLTLNGVVNNSGFTITLGENASVTRNSGYVIGSVKKVFGQIFAFGGGINFVYHVGTANGYSPVTAFVTSGVAGSDLTVTAKQGTQPNLPTTTTLQRYWTLTENGTLTANLQFNYLPTDTPGVEANYQVIRVESGVPAFYPGGTVNTTGDFFQTNNVSNFSDWTAGESITLAPTAATANINGRVTDSLGRGVENATLTLTGGALTEPISINTDVSGRYRMPEVLAGDTYILTVSSKRHSFSQPTIVISVTESLTDINFVADGN